MTKGRFVQVGDTRVTYTVVRSARRQRTLSLAFDREGSLRVLVPIHTPDAAITAMVHSHVDWIERQLSRLRAQPRPATGLPPTTWLNGVEVGLQVAPSALTNARVRASEGGLRVDVPAGDPDSMSAAASVALLNWYSRRARAVVAEPLERYSSAMKVRPIAISIRNQRTRWGSYSPTGRLSFNLRLAMLPSALVDYVVVHELAHMTHHNHSDRFWSLVAEHIEDVAGHRRALREWERKLPRFER